MLRLRFSLSDNFRPGQNPFSDIGKRAKDLRPLQARWVGFLRKKASERFDELSGPPLAESTQLKYAHTGVKKVTAHGKLRASYAEKLQRYFRKSGGTVHHAEVDRLRRGDTDFSSSSRAVERARKAIEKSRTRKPGAPRAGKADAENGVTLKVVREKGRLRVRVDSPGYDTTQNVAFPVGKRREGARFSVPAAALKQVRGGSYFRVAARAVGGKDARKIDNHKLLGNERYALAGRFISGGVAFEITTPYSRIHNEGGTAGNGAKIPKRTTLEIRPEDEAELAKIAAEHMLGQGSGGRS